MAVALKLACTFLLSILLFAPMTHAITCGQVTGSLAPCIDYLKSGGSGPPVPCCDGVRTLNNAASTTRDRQDACKCLKSAAGNIAGIKPNLASGLPVACGVNVPYKISTSTDCSKVR